jgi:tetratricopeptide (TPR) repeat protein
MVTAYERLKLDEANSSNPAEILRGVELSPRALQDFVPMCRSLEWELSNLYWNTAGTRGFVENGIPYTINNTGRLSEAAAALLFRNCEEARDPGPVLVLEFGAGTALFARYFLDEFERLCTASAADYYDRLLYYVTDRSPRTVEQWNECGLFAGHEKHVVKALCDAMQPAVVRTPDGEQIRLENVRAVFANYVLDSLPATFARRGPNGVEELCVRTHLIADEARVRQYTTLSLEELRRLAASNDLSAREALIACAPVFDYEQAYLPAGSISPEAEEALAFGHDLPRVLINYGAFQCLHACLEILNPGGFVLINDYGAVQKEESAQQGALQRFGPTTALGLNFPLLEHHFTTRSVIVDRPDQDADLPIHPRLLARRSLPETRAEFQKLFGMEAQRVAEGKQDEARQHLEAGRADAARACFTEALERRPRDWRLLGEVAEFVIRRAADYRAGLELARSAVRINPWYSAWLWNVLGDALFALDRFEEAHEAYLQARRIDPKDVRTNLNLSYSYAQACDLPRALQAIAEGLANDGSGLYRDRLLEKQQQIVAQTSARWNGEQEWQMRRAHRLR